MSGAAFSRSPRGFRSRFFPGSSGRFGFGQRDQPRQPSVVVPPATGNQEMRLRARVWWAFFRIADEGFAAGGRFDEKLIVADQGDDLVVAVDAVFTEHFLGRDFSCSGHLLDEVVNGALPGCHEVMSSFKRNAEAWQPATCGSLQQAPLHLVCHPERSEERTQSKGLSPRTCSPDKINLAGSFSSSMKCW